MKTIYSTVLFAVLAIAAGSTEVRAQQAKPSNDTASPAAAAEKAYSGMYTFLKEGEFVQVSVEDAGHVTGFISRYGDGESDSGVFLDQFFKTGKLEGNKLTFTTQLVHGVTFEFKGTIERGEGKNPGDEAYYVLKGTLTKNVSDANKKATSQSQEVVFKMFPEEAQAPPR
ncbi:MAG: hypothetical protein WAM79_22615 [Candidatus Sulfotelmatobacter sp.]